MSRTLDGASNLAARASAKVSRQRLEPAKVNHSLPASMCRAIYRRRKSVRRRWNETTDWALDLYTAAKFCRQILVEQVGRLEHMPVGIDDLKSISHDLAPFLLIVAVIAAATDRFTESVGCS